MIEPLPAPASIKLDNDPPADTRKPVWTTRGLMIATALLVLPTLFRLWYGSWLNLAEDEAYYWQWSRFPALSYYDQGPGVAWSIWFGTHLLGDSLLGIRLGNILLGCGTGLFTLLTARRWLSERVALWVTLLMTVVPLLAVGSFLATYDVPQVFCWAAALYVLTVTVQANRTWGWYGVGVLVGLGTLSKVTMILFAPCVLIYLLVSARHRRWLFTPHPYLAFALGMVLYAPVFVWNAQNDWVGFQHWAMLGDRTRNAAPLRWFGDFWGGQLIALSPFLLIGEIAALVTLARSLRRNKPGGNADAAVPTFGQAEPEREAARFLLSFAVPILLLCSVVSLRSKMEINWPVPTHLAGIIALGWWLDRRWQRGIRPRVGIVLSCVVAVLMVTLVYFPELLPAMGLRLTALQAQKLNQPYGWQPIADRVQAARDILAREGKPVFVWGVNYRVNSVMAYYLPDRPQTQSLFLRSRRDQYWLWTKPQTLIGQNAVFYLDDENEDAVALARRYFDSVTPLPDLKIYRPGFSGPAKWWRFYLCRNFHGYDPLRHVDGY